MGVRPVNEKDLQLVKIISSEIQTEGESALYLISVKYTNLVRLNLVLLKALLERKRKKGIMITIDRPHQYVSHLLQLHGIDQSNLSFVDAISVQSSDTKGGAVAAEFQKGPFHIEVLPEFIAGSNGSDADISSEFSMVEFVVMDNVSTLLTYNTMASVETFFTKYLDVLRERSTHRVITVLAMDKDVHSVLFEFVSEIATKTIELSPDMQITHIFQGSPGGLAKNGISKGVI